MQKNIGLEIARGLAALTVLWAHICGFLYAPLLHKRDADILTRIFDASSGYGHQAVVVFFVLSGFLIASSLIRTPAAQFSWISYLCARLSRLWVVLIPSLVLTLAINSAGMHFDARGFYLGELNYLYHGQRNEPVDLSPETFIKNLMFLQTLYAKNYGDNESLWSLSYEFWYYILFPLVWRALFAVQRIEKAICAGLSVLVLIFLPARVLELGLVWLLGAVCALIRSDVWKIKVPNLVDNRYVLVVLLVLSLQATHSLPLSAISKDLQLAIVFSVFVLGSGTLIVRRLWLAKLIGMLSDISYSMYAVHFSILAFIVVVGFESQFVERSIKNIWIGLSVGSVIVAYSTCFYWLFERNTQVVRRNMEMFVRRFSRKGRVVKF